jgi:hypothetical protein
VTARDWLHFVVAIGVERDKRELAVGTTVRHSRVVMLDDHRAARGDRRQDDDERREHVVGLLGILVSGEKLTWLVNEQVVQLGRQLGAVRQPQVAPHLLEHRRQRPCPPRLVECDQALRDLPSITDSRIESRSVLQPVARRACDRRQPPRVRSADRERDAADALDLEVQIARWTGAARRKAAAGLDRGELVANFIEGDHRSGRQPWIVAASESYVGTGPTAEEKTRNASSA